MKRVRSVGIHVSDQQRALDFYTGVLGCSLVTDQPMGEGAGAPRWIEVRLPADETRLILFTPPGEEARIGTFTSVILACDDIAATHRELSARGAGFRAAPRREPWGMWAELQDPDGNVFGLVEGERA